MKFMFHSMIHALGRNRFFISWTKRVTSRLSQALMAPRETRRQYLELDGGCIGMARWIKCIEWMARWIKWKFKLDIVFSLENMIVPKVSLNMTADHPAQENCTLDGPPFLIGNQFKSANICQHITQWNNRTVRLGFTKPRFAIHFLPARGMPRSWRKDDCASVWDLCCWGMFLRVHHVWNELLMICISKNNKRWDGFHFSSIVCEKMWPPSSPQPAGIAAAAIT